MASGSFILILHKQSLLLYIFVKVFVSGTIQTHVLRCQKGFGGDSHNEFMAQSPVQQLIDFKQSLLLQNTIKKYFCSAFIYRSVHKDFSSSLR